MEYKYKKNQVFGKKLNVPAIVQSNIYNNILTIEDYIKYDLEGKVPTSCLKAEDAKILEIFGVERLKNVDFELVVGLSHQLQMKDLLLNIEPTVEDINLVMYESVKDLVAPIYYSTRMKSLYPTRVFDIDETELTARENQAEYDINYLKYEFNRGTIRISDIIKNWNLFQTMDIGYCLKNDPKNIYNITDEQLKLFMYEYGSIIELILEEEKDIYEVIYNIYGIDKDEEEKTSYLSRISENILYKRVDTEKLTNEQYKALFSYASLETYLTRYNEYAVMKLFNELEGKEEDYIYNIEIPISVLMDSDVLSFIGTYGLENILEFDRTHNNFFTKEDYKNLKLIAPAYLYYANGIHEPERKLFTKNLTNVSEYSENYTKEEFYEAIRRMIIYGPTDWSYKSEIIDVRDLEGEFRDLNDDLFLDDNAPEELKDLFYSKKITPIVLAENPEYIPFLKDKNLACCFEDIEVLIVGNNYYQFKNLYQYLVEQSNFASAMNIILQYAEVFDVIFDNNNENLELLSSDHFMGNLKKFNDAFRKKIIEQNVKYPSKIPSNLKDAYNNMFLSDDAPEELKEMFYSRKITAKYILEHPEYESYLKDIDIECLYPYISVVVSTESKLEVDNLVALMKKIYGKDVFSKMLVYGDVLSFMYGKDEYAAFHLNGNVTKELLEENLNQEIIAGILNGKIKYNENMPNEIKISHPEFFLADDVPSDLKEKFYNRELTMDDFENPEIAKYFDNTNIACGVSLEYSWLINLFNEYDVKESNEYRKKLYDAYIRIDDIELQSIFMAFIKQSSNSLDVDKIDKISEVLQRVSYSNSSEMYNFRYSLALQILKTDDPMDSLKKVEAIFLKNNIPTVGKIFSVFELLHPECKDFNFDDNSMASPVLKEKSSRGRMTTIFADLIKASFGSNNRSIKSYLDNIELGYSLYLKVMSEQVTYDSLNEQEKHELSEFRSHLLTLYNNTQKGKKEPSVMEISNNVMDDITRLYALFSPDGSANYNLADRVISMFAHFAGIDTLEEAKGYFTSKVLVADEKNREASKQEMIIEAGDFVKGIGGIEYLSSLLQNGIVSKEFLGASANSDSTPLDTDLSMIVTPGENTEFTIESTAASSYGPIMIILKKDRVQITRIDDWKEIEDKNITKLEAFYVGISNTENSQHYGIRTGFASTDIDYIVTREYDERIGLEIALNGFYIPVYDVEGNLLFTPEYYDSLRNKMGGLSYYTDEKYVISNNLNIPGVENYLNILNEKEATNKINKDKIKSVIAQALTDVGLTLKETLDKDLSPGSVEVIGTGSSERNTDLTGSADIDLLMRLDRNIVNSRSELDKVRKILALRFGKDLNSVNAEGNLNLRDVVIDGNRLDIDISFTKKTDEIAYSTEMALNDRLSVIRYQEPTLYSYVISNILLAKQVLKEAEAYKPNRGLTPQGGLGGVGIENWILQHGGSFMDAARTFIEASTGRDYEEFKRVYSIWDFGENHLAARKGVYIHDNFVRTNMSEEGYIKMKQALIDYFNKYNLNVESEKSYIKEQ